MAVEEVGVRAHDLALAVVDHRERVCGAGELGRGVERLDGSGLSLVVAARSVDDDDVPGGGENVDGRVERVNAQREVLPRVCGEVLVVVASELSRICDAVDVEGWRLLFHVRGPFGVVLEEDGVSAHVDVVPEDGVEADAEHEEIARAAQAAHALDLGDGDVDLLVHLLHIRAEVQHVAVPPRVRRVPEGGGDRAGQNNAQGDGNGEAEAVVLLPLAVGRQCGEQRGKRHCGRSSCLIRYSVGVGKCYMEYCTSMCCLKNNCDCRSSCMYFCTFSMSSGVP